MSAAAGYGWRHGLRHGLRLTRAGWVLAGHSALLPAAAMVPMPLRALAAAARWRRRRRAATLAQDLQSLGPSYIKLGQFLATRRDIIGEALAVELSALQDRMPPFAMAQARRAVTQELGRPPDEIFKTFGEPVAAASIAQVHRAQTADGHDVAVKVLRPGIEKLFARDMAGFAWAARMMERTGADARRLRPVEVVRTLAESVAIEMDLRLEAAAMSEMGENTRDDGDFRVPAVDWERTARRVLTLEWVAAQALSDPAAVKAAGHDMTALASRVITVFLTHAIRDGFFHADMHPGNLFVDREGCLVAVDFGIMGRLDEASRRYLAEILYGFLQRDYRRVAEVHFEAGYVPRHHDVGAFSQALRAIGEPILGRDAADISMARLLSQLFQVTGQFDMRTQTQLLLLQKTMVVVEGVARTLDPGHNMWKSAAPVLSRWLAAGQGAEARMREVAGAAAALGRVVKELPGWVERAERAGLPGEPEEGVAGGRGGGRGRRGWMLAAALAAAGAAGWILAGTGGLP